MSPQPFGVPDGMPHPYETSCVIKVRYASEASAQKASARARRTYGALQQIYYCPWCDGYHLTTVARRRF